MQENLSDNQFLLQTLYTELKTICRINTKTGTVRFIQSAIPVFKANDVVSYDTFVHEFSISTTLYPDDKEFATNQMELSELRRHCKENETGEYLKYRYIKDDKVYWMSVTVFRAPDYSEEHPEVLLVGRELNKNESHIQESREIINKQLHKIFIQNASTNENYILKQYKSERYITDRLKHLNDEHIKAFISNGMIYPEDLEIIRPYTENKYLENYFTSKHQHLSFFYRRKIGNIFHWVNHIIAPTSNFTDTNKELVSYIIDANESILKYFDIQAYSEYENLLHQLPKKTSENYYDNVIRVLNFLTSKYINFYLIDLQKDLFVNYKITQAKNISEAIGIYSSLCEKYNPDYEQTMEGVSVPIATIEQLRYLLSERQTITYKFKSRSGKMLTNTYTKIEDQNGMPTKVFCYHIPAKENNTLKIQTFGNFEVYKSDDTPLIFSKKLSKEIFAYLVDKRGYSVTTKDLIQDILEKDTKDLNAAKYISKLICSAIKDLENAGFENVIVREKNSLHMNENKIDCDFYNLLDGDAFYWQFYHNEYMKDYSWAEETNAMLLHLYDK